MPTYTTPLRLKILADGEEPGQWGTTTNTNLSTVLEAAITGVLPIVMVDAPWILTTVNGSADQARNAVLVFTGTNTGIRQVIPPLVQKTYTVTNNTIGGYAITIGGITGALVTIPNGATAQVYCSGTGFYLVSTTIPNANTVMNSTKLTGLTAGTTTGDSVEYAQMNTAVSTALATEHGQLQTQTYTAFTTTGGPTAFAATASPAISGAVTTNTRLRLKFNVASSGTPTLVLGTTTAALQQYDATGTLVAATLGLNQLTDVEYNGTVYVVLDPLTPVIVSVLPGTIIAFAGTTAPTGYLACPAAASAVSRVTYAALFAAIGTTWGVGDGTTTFGIPYFAADQVPVQQWGGAGAVGTTTTGVIPAHVHTLGMGGHVSGSAFGGGGVDHQAVNTGSYGTGTNNLPAGSRVQYCVKY